MADLPVLELQQQLLNALDGVSWPLNLFLWIELSRSDIFSVDYNSRLEIAWAWEDFLQT